ncbi:mCG4466 [Mus musculus]|nr:mCG4466 [Mus musculus]
MNACDESESGHSRALSDFRAIEMSNNSSSIMCSLLIPERVLMLFVCGGRWNWGKVMGRRECLPRARPLLVILPTVLPRLNTGGIMDTRIRSLVDSKSNGHERMCKVKGWKSSTNAAISKTELFEHGSEKDRLRLETGHPTSRTGDGTRTVTR